MQPQPSIHVTVSTARRYQVNRSSSSMLTATPPDESSSPPLVQPQQTTNLAQTSPVQPPPVVDSGNCAQATQADADDTPVVQQIQYAPVSRIMKRTSHHHHHHNHHNSYHHHFHAMESSSEGSDPSASNTYLQPATGLTQQQDATGVVAEQPQHAGQRRVSNHSPYSRLTTANGVHTGGDAEHHADVLDRQYDAVRSRIFGAPVAAQFSEPQGNDEPLTPDAYHTPGGEECAAAVTSSGPPHDGPMLDGRQQARKTKHAPRGTVKSEEQHEYRRNHLPYGMITPAPTPSSTTSHQHHHHQYQQHYPSATHPTNVPSPSFGYNMSSELQPPLHGGPINAYNPAMPPYPQSYMPPPPSFVGSPDPCRNFLGYPPHHQQHAGPRSGEDPIGRGGLYHNHHNPQHIHQEHYSPAYGETTSFYGSKGTPRGGLNTPVGPQGFPPSSLHHNQHYQHMGAAPLHPAHHHQFHHGNGGFPPFGNGIGAPPQWYNMFPELASTQGQHQQHGVQQTRGAGSGGGRGGGQGSGGVPQPVRQVDGKVSVVVGVAPAGLASNHSTPPTTQLNGQAIA